MGFAQPAIRLEFAGTAYAGLEVRMRPLTVGQMLEAMALAEGSNDSATLGGMIELLAGLVVDWNLTDDQCQPIPCTSDALRNQVGADLVVAVMQAATSSVAGVAPPLPMPSGDGAIPMEVLPESL